MSEHDVSALEALFEGWRSERTPDLDQSLSFERFVAEQITKDFDLSDEEISSGIIGGQDDGGIDGFYLFINRTLMQDETPIPQQATTVELCLIQAKYGLGFGEDAIRKTPFLYKGPLSKKVKPMEHLVTVMINGDAVAYPFSVLKKRPVVNDEVAGVPIVVFFDKTTRTALGREKIKSGKAIGTGAVFDRRVEGRTMSFAKKGDFFVDRETGSIWNVLGVATSGPLKGKRLERVVSGDFFAFAWIAFRPHTRIYRP